MQEVQVSTSINKVEVAEITKSASALSVSSLKPKDCDNFKRELESVHSGLQLFMNSEFDAAESEFKAKAACSMYHGLGYSAIKFLKAVMTLDSAYVDDALYEASHTLQLSDLCRKKSSLMASLSSYFGGIPSPKFAKMTMIQRHAELVHAEMYVIRALITLLSDDAGWLLLLKEAMNIRQSFGVYKSAAAFLDVLDSPESAEEDDGSIVERDLIDDNFTSGVLLGIGLFNLMVSLLPPRIVRMIELAGIPSDQQRGLECLMLGAAQKGLRSEFCKVSLLFYHLVLSTYLDLSFIDLDAANVILSEKIAQYPQSLFYNFFNARFHFIRKDYEEAKKFYQLAKQCQNSLPQLAHICYWDLTLLHTLNMEYQEALAAADYLSKENKWSKTFHLYVATILRLTTDPSASTRDQMETIASLKRRVIGKSIPLEKFVARKARKYLSQNYLLLPLLEMCLVWNGFRLMKRETLESHLLIVVDAIKNLNSKLDEAADDLALCYLLQAVILSELDQSENSRNSFASLFGLTKSIKLDHWYTPFGYLEYARLLFKEGLLDEGAGAINKGLQFSKYSLENMINMRLHSCLKKNQK